MRVYLDCLDCCFHSFIGQIKNFEAADQVKEGITRDFLRYLSELDYNKTPPHIAKFVQDKIREYIGIDDPYIEVKIRYNRQMAANYDIFRKRVQADSDPVRAALLLAIAGNIIDVGPNEKFDIEGTIEGALERELVCDDSGKLIDDLKKADSLLYLADNAGEIVLDRLFIETLINQKIITPDKVTVAVRGGPAQNDATMREAEEAGLTEIVKVITNGDRSPGTILESVSEEFKEHFFSADLIISKGQGNFETLTGVTGRNLYFLLITKCRLIAEELALPVNSFVCKNEFYPL